MSEVSTEQLCARLDELVSILNFHHFGWESEFTMRIPAEPARDADLVMSAAATRLRKYEKWFKDNAANLPYPPDWCLHCETQTD